MVASPNCNKSLPEPPNNSFKPFHNVILPTPLPYNPRMLIEPLDLLGIETWMRKELRAFVFGVIKNLYLVTDARTRSFTPCVLLKKTRRVMMKE